MTGINTGYGEGFQLDRLFTGTANADAAVLFTAGGALPAAQLLANSHVIQPTAGSCTVEGSVDGTTFVTAPLAVEDLHSTTPGTRVTVMAPGRAYLLRGSYSALRVKQSGVTAAAASLRSFFT